jgi:hypothetical protein
MGQRPLWLNGFIDKGEEAIASSPLFFRSTSWLYFFARAVSCFFRAAW